jgi:hypothetical protein
VHPRSLPPFTVIRIPFSFDDGFTYQSKLFVILGNCEHSTFCLKPTSQTKFFDNNPDKRCGCVCYEVGEVGFFGKRTIIDPDNQIEIRHEKLDTLYDRGELAVIGKLPDDFGDRLRVAISKSQTLDRNGKCWLKAVLPGY